MVLHRLFQSVALGSPLAVWKRQPYHGGNARWGDSDHALDTRNEVEWERAKHMTEVQAAFVSQRGKLLSQIMSSVLSQPSRKTVDP